MTRRLEEMLNPARYRSPPELDQRVLGDAAPILDEKAMADRSVRQARRTGATVAVVAGVALVLILACLWLADQDLGLEPLDGAADTSPFRGMVLIPEGPYDQGTTRAEAEDLFTKLGLKARVWVVERYWEYQNRQMVEESARRVQVDAFYLDRYEVTNLQFYHYMKATGAAPPELPRDNPACWRQGRLPGSTQLYFEDEVRSWPLLVARLKATSADTVRQTPAGRIWTLLDPELQEQVKNIEPGHEPERGVKIALIRALNQQVKMRDWYDEAFFRGINLSVYVPEAARLLARGIQNLSRSERQLFNRYCLDNALAGAVRKGQPPEMMEYPVTGISYFQARSCAGWMGKRLPTEAEWEKAARGPARNERPARYWPWGNQFGEEQTACCNWALYWVSPLNTEQKPMGLCPVGSFSKGASEYGIQDLIGNALEYTADSWGPHPATPAEIQRSFDPLPGENLAVIKGGAYGEQFKGNLIIAFRYAMEKSQSSEAVGFRAARDAQLGARDLQELAWKHLGQAAAGEAFSIDRDRGLAAAEKVTYLDARASIVTGRRWLGVATADGSAFSSHDALREASVNARGGNRRGRVRLGVLHTDVVFATPHLEPGDYSVVFVAEEASAGTPRNAGRIEFLSIPGGEMVSMLPDPVFRPDSPEDRTRLVFRSSGPDVDGVPGTSDRRAAGPGVDLHLVLGTGSSGAGAKALALDLTLTGPQGKELEGWFVQPESSEPRSERKIVFAELWGIPVVAIVLACLALFFAAAVVLRRFRGRGKVQPRGD